MITLKDFMKETLAQITEAAREFQAENGEGGKVKVLGPQVHANGKSCVKVDFDVTVAAEEADKTGGSGSLKVLSAFQLSGEKENSKVESSGGRINFSVALYSDDFE